MRRLQSRRPCESCGWNVQAVRRNGRDSPRPQLPLVHTVALPRWGFVAIKQARHMLLSAFVTPGHPEPSPVETCVLLVEADLDARARHEGTLSSAGYAVTTVAACPEPTEVLAADVVLSDIPSFHWLQD